MTPINNQYYSTGDFYPRWPSNWRKGKGAWHGWNWYKGARANEIKAGDKLCSPFVAAGWDRNPEKNIRPSQWLALLKHLSVTGSEFFNTAFFNIKKPLPDPENYFWQAVTPVYAQAITSHYEEILRKGQVLKNSNGEFLFEIESDNSQALVSVRKLENKYIIVGSLQPSLLNLLEIPDTALVTCTIDGRELKFEVRKQGSVYFADFSDEKTPIFYQLDEWHEKGHPQHWSKNISINALLFDSCDGCEITTESFNELNKLIDISKTESFLHQKNKNPSSIVYSLPLKEESEYILSLKIKGEGSKKKPKIICKINGQEINTIKAKSDEWATYEFGKVKKDNIEDLKLEVMSNGNFYLKEIILQRI